MSKKTTHQAIRDLNDAVREFKKAVYAAQWLILINKMASCPAFGTESYALDCIINTIRPKIEPYTEKKLLQVMREEADLRKGYRNEN